jgi:hypothetical protein
VPPHKLVRASLPHTVPASGSHADSQFPFLGSSTDIGDPQEVECLRLPFSATAQVFSIKPAELQKPCLVRMEGKEAGRRSGIEGLELAAPSILPTAWDIF